MVSKGKEPEVGGFVICRLGRSSTLKEKGVVFGVGEEGFAKAGRQAQHCHMQMDFWSRILVF